MPNYQLKFDKANVTAPFDSLAPNEVSYAQNIDFSIAQGGIIARRGNTVMSTVGGAGIIQIFRNYNLPTNIAACPTYAIDSAGSVWRSAGGFGGWIAIGTVGGVINNGINAFGNYTVIGGMGATLKDDGTQTTDWIKQTPPVPAVTINTLTPLDISGGTATYSVTDGVLVAGTKTCTFSTDANGNASVLMVLSSSTATNAGVDLDHNGSNQIGAMGIYFVNMAFSDPTIVTRVSQDYSVGDGSFNSYWHAEITPTNGIVVPLNADPTTLVNAQLNVGTSSTTVLTIDQKAEMISQIRDQTQPALSGLSQLAGTMSPWGVGRTEFGFVGPYTGTGSTAASPWSNVYAVRFNIQCLSSCTATIDLPKISGALNFPLNDISVGYTWWQTYATLDANNNKIGEGPPSPPVGPFQIQQANASVTAGGTATGSSGVNAIITYRQGGYAQTGYAVNTSVSGAFTDSLNDIQAISLNFPLVTNIAGKGDYTFANIFCIAEPFLNRVFYGENNNIRWSLPGQLDTYPRTSFAQVSYSGDNVKALSAWPTGLVIINQNSVYEFTGGNLEGGQFQLTRSAAQKGSIAPNVCVKTPYGVPLLGYDGLSLYQPGQGVAVEIDWLRQEYGDMFYGGGPGSPGVIKYAPGFEGVISRCRPINYSQIINACAAYGQGKLYLAVPTGTNAFNDTVYAIDLINKKVNMYTYAAQAAGVGISALFWDYQNNNLIAGTTDGKLLSLENSQSDTTTGGAGTGVTFQAVTQQWTVPTDTVLENVSALVQATDPITLVSIMDGLPTGTATLTSTASTTGGAVRSWIHIPLGGTFVNSLAFSITGTQNDTGLQDGFFQLNFDLLPEPAKVVYYRTAYDDKSYEADKKWDVFYADVDIVGTGTVTAVTFVDSTAVMTNTVVATGSTGRKVYEFAFPAEIYGRVAYSTYTGTNTFTSTLTSGSTTNFYGTAIGSATTTSSFTSVSTATATASGTATVTATATHTTSYTVTVISTATATATATTGTVTNTTTTTITNTTTYFPIAVATATATATGPGGAGTATYTMSATATTTSETFTSTATATATGSGDLHNLTYTSSGPNYFKHWRTYYDARNEPAKINYWRTDIQSLDEQICDAFDVDINPNGTVLATCFIDNVAVSTATITGANRQSYTETLPKNAPGDLYLYGRTIYVVYTGVGLKHYRTWFHLRPEPDRWTSYVTDKLSLDEHEWKVFKPTLNPLGGTVLCTAFVEGTAVGTYTATGTDRIQYTFSLPAATFGRSIWAAYNVASPGMFFKHYAPMGINMYTRDLEFEGVQEPPRVTIWREGPMPYMSSQYLKTWSVLLDPLGDLVTGTLTVDDIAIATCTFTGNKRQWFTVGLDVDAFENISTGSRWEALYTSVGTGDFLGKFKHYKTQMEVETKPFGKDRWAYSYRKLGGASQIDLARFWSFEAESASSLPIYYTWDINGTTFTTGTITLTGGVQWIDRISLPPGGRGYLFLFSASSNNPAGTFQSGTPFKVYKVNLDLDQEGIKGLVRRETPGTPDSRSAS